MYKFVANFAAAVASAGMLAVQDETDLFAKLDANKDGYVSLDEVPEQQRALFERLLRKAGKEDEKKLNKVLFQAALKSEDAPQQPLGGPQPPGRRPGAVPGGRPDPRELESLFERTDANSDGKLTKDEVPEERQGIRRIFERTGGDSITKEQFVRAMSMFEQPPPGAPGRRPDGAPRPPGAPDRRPEGFGPPPGGLFATLDTDRDGQLSTAEIVGAGTALLKLDRNGDGKLTPDETFSGPPGRPAMPRPGEGRPGEGRPPEGRRPAEGRPAEARPGERRPQDAPPGDFEAFRERLKQADANGDGKLSVDEAPDRIKQNFDRADANSDGFLDEEESRQIFQRLRRGAK